jgi:hypothetical protein
MKTGHHAMTVHRFLAFWIDFARVTALATSRGMVAGDDANFRSARANSPYFTRSSDPILAILSWATVTARRFRNHPTLQASWFR